MISPYITGGPVSKKEFYGRSNLLAEICAGRQRAFYILGTRQVGKTSLLHELDTRLPALSLDVQWAAGELSDLIGQANWELNRKRTRVSWLPPKEVIPQDNLFVMLRVINDLVQQAGQILWVLLDEAEGLLEVARSDSSILHRLRGTIQNCQALRFVLVAAKTLTHADEISTSQGFSPFLSGFSLRYLHGLTQETAAALLRQTQAPATVEIDDDVLARIFKLSNGHPLILQLLGERLFDHGRLRVPNDDDLIAIGDILERLGVFGKDFLYLTDAERDTLQAVIAKKTLSVKTDVSLLYNLTQLGYLRREDEQYAIGNFLFDRWLRDRAPWETTSAGSTTDNPNQVATLGQSTKVSQAPVGSQFFIQGDYIVGDKPTGVDQRGQAVQGAQTNVAGNVNGPLASGQFDSATTVGGCNTTDNQSNKEDE